MGYKFGRNKQTHQRRQTALDKMPAGVPMKLRDCTKLGLTSDDMKYLAKHGAVKRIQGYYGSATSRSTYTKPAGRPVATGPG